MRRTALALVLLTLSTACAPTAPLQVTTWGEAFIEEGLPADVFEDGWAVTFSTFLVAYTSVQVKDAAGAEVSTFTAPAVFDLVKPGPVTVVDLGEVTAQRYDDVGAVVAPAAGAVAGNADDADVATMNEGGLSVHVVGAMEKGADRATFSWSFTAATRYSGCETEGEGAGMVVRGGEQNELQLTVHGDHLFYDDLAADDAVLRGDALFAADGADGSVADGDISQAELAAVDLTTLPGDQYGNAGAAETLADFVASLSRTLLHLNGEGECSISSP